MRDLLAFFIGVDIGVVALDLFGYSVIARSIKVRGDECDVRTGQSITLSKDCGFGCRLLLF